MLEVAVLNVLPDQTDAFEAAMHTARPLIEATPGFRGMELRRCVETADRYLLLVSWRSMEDHTVGFRGSERYRIWRELLHDFYFPFPTVEHYIGL